MLTDGFGCWWPNSRTGAVRGFASIVGAVTAPSDQEQRRPTAADLSVTLTGRLAIVQPLAAEHEAGLEGSFEERPGARQVALVLQQTSEVVEARRGLGMLRAERLLADRQRALVEWPRPGEVALGLEQAGEVVEARRGIGMLGAERLLANRERALVERPRAGKVALVLKQAGEVIEARRGRRDARGRAPSRGSRARARKARATLCMLRAPPCLYEASRSRR